MIRASIQKDSFEKMDRRVKPGNDIQVRGAAEDLNVIFPKENAIPAEPEWRQGL